MDIDVNAIIMEYFRDFRMLHMFNLYTVPSKSLVERITITPGYPLTRRKQRAYNKAFLNHSTLNCIISAKKSCHIFGPALTMIFTAFLSQS